MGRADGSVMNIAPGTWLRSLPFAPSARKQGFSSREVERELAFGPFRLQPSRKMLLEAGKPVPLGSRAIEILVALLEQPGEIVSKERLLAHVWPDTHVIEANLRVHIAALRKTLGKGDAEARYIATISGRGYCFVAATSLRETPLAEADAADQSVRILGGDGRNDEALATIDEALALSHRYQEPWGLPELLRIKGELLLQSDTAGSEALFRNALDLARQQGSLSWELRAAISLAELRRYQKRDAEAQAVLAPVYDRVVAAFPTTDLARARAVLNECQP